MVQCHISLYHNFIRFSGLTKSSKTNNGSTDVQRAVTRSHIDIKQVVRVATQYMPPPPVSWQHLRIYSPGGTCSVMLAI